MSTIFKFEELVKNEFVDDLIEKQPDIVWVSLGFSKQEEFIDLLLKKHSLSSIFCCYLGAVFELRRNKSQSP